MPNRQRIGEIDIQGKTINTIIFNEVFLSVLRL